MKDEHSFRLKQKHGSLRPFQGSIWMIMVNNLKCKVMSREELPKETTVPFLPLKNSSLEPLSCQLAITQRNLSMCKPLWFGKDGPVQLRVMYPVWIQRKRSEITCEGLELQSLKQTSTSIIWYENWLWGWSVYRISLGLKASKGFIFEESVSRWSC